MIQTHESFINRAEIPLQLSTTRLEQDSVALATWNGIWHEDVVTAMNNDDVRAIRSIHDQQERMEVVVARAIGTNKLSETPHISFYMDRFFQSILSHNNTYRGNNFAELAYMGINPSGLESEWKRLVPIAKRYVNRRQVQFDQTGTQNLLDHRKQTVIAVRNKLNSQLGDFFGRHATSSPQIIAQAYKDLPISMHVPIQTAEIAHVEQEFLKHADQKLAESLGVTLENVPFSYSWLTKQHIDGMVMPQFDKLVEINKHAQKGSQIHLNCCPNYATEKRPNGKHVYTFSNLGTDIGLTAERGFPLLMAMIKRVHDMQQQGLPQQMLHIRVAVADFEATEANAQLVGLTVQGFKEHLGTSIQSMIKQFEDFAKRTHLSSSVQRNNKNIAIGEWGMQLGKAANISFGAISESYQGLRNYKGEETFKNLVEAKRNELEAKALGNKAFQEQLHGILGLRMGIMLRWSDGTETPLVRHLAQMFDYLTASDFAIPLKGSDQFSDDDTNQPDLNELQHALNAITQTSASSIEKSDACKKTILAWLKEGSNRREDKRRDSLTFLRVKVARQGAEDAVMSELHAQFGGAQIVADSSAMWEVFGDSRIPKIIVKGNYEGADK